MPIAVDLNGRMQFTSVFKNKIKNIMIDNCIDYLFFHLIDDKKFNRIICVTR